MMVADMEHEVGGLAAQDVAAEWMGYEAARHDGPARTFATLADALGHLEGSERDSTRPYLRVNSRRVIESFLVVGGRKLDANCRHTPPQLPMHDQALLDAWRFEDPHLRRLQASVDADESQSGHERPRMRG